jgi:hypothetical protein
MTITDRDALILRLLRRYKFLTTAQIRDRCIPHDRDGRITRDRLGKLRQAGLARKLQAEVVDPLHNSTAPVWLPTEKGCHALALRTGEMSCLLDAVPGTDAWQNLAHYTAVSQLHLTLDAALAKDVRVRMDALYFEHDVVNADEREPSKKYRLHTVVSSEPKRVVCVPDSAFEIQLGEYRRAYYTELERGTDTPGRVAAKKTPGYAGLALTRKWLAHFPHAEDFAVIAFCPNPGWRDALRREVSSKQGSELWRFAALSEINADTVLTAPLFYTCTAGPFPFVGAAS